MKRQMFFATTFSAALAVSVAAQSGTPPQTGAQREQTQAGAQVTMTGCLKPADAMSGTTGTATGTGSTSAQSGKTAASGEAQFILTDAMQASATGSAPASPSTSGTTGAASAAANRYRLLGKQDELRKHVNAKVEIRGTIEERPMGSGAAGTGTGSGTGSGTAASGSASDRNLPAFKVVSIKKVADTCTPQ